ncbi:cytochrome P450 [Rhodococcus sp. HNM0569]|uniref:cytochrome P450 n=1 Tax=Rhodococcus sp. HNM0569 TaxID=2716340 RepID=UPI00146E1C4E|nr:cytochrome P450 [Rhodococcus sp. HNM0569]NLU83314.1 cytochrome P450 [Rhodococcus sp. HNM0569]
MSHVAERTEGRSFLFDPYDYAFHEDPYPIYRTLRDEHPLYHNTDLGFWALSRHADVFAAVRDAKRLSNANGVSLDPAARGPHAYRVMSFLAMDDPRHLRVRNLVSRGFTPRRIKEMEGRIRELAVAHLDAALEHGRFDFVAEFAGKLPMDVISELMGVPEEDRDRIRGLADAVMHREENLLDVPQSAAEASMELIVYYTDMIAQRRRQRTDDLTSALLDAEIDGDALAEEEIVAFLFLMVIAGNETTTKLLANAVYWGWRFPDQMRQVAADHDLVPAWAEETLRYDTSSQLVARTATTDIELHDGTIPEGDIVLLLLGSANRDPRVFDSPDTFDIHRDMGRSLASFGAGSHFCLGAHLARLEADVALRELLARAGSIEVDEENAVRVHSSNVRGFAELPVEIRRK